MSKPSSTEEQENQPKKSKLDPTIIVAVVTLIGTVVTAVLASPVLIAWIQKMPDAKTSGSQPTSASPQSTSEPSVTSAAKPNNEKSSPSPSLNVAVTNTPVLTTSSQIACITLLDNPQVPVVVDASSLSFSGGSILPLVSGQSIPFTEMRKLQVTDIITSPPPVIRVNSIKVMITLLDGTIISDVLDGNGHLNGKTKFGGFGKSLDKIKIVEFKEQSNC